MIGMRDLKIGNNFLTKQKYSVELTVPNKDDYEQK